MRKSKCICCGNSISKSALNDPYLCRDCESHLKIGNAERYGYLDV